MGALSGFEYVAIVAGETRSAARTIGRSVMISAPVIALMFILGTSSVLASTGDKSVNTIATIPQTLVSALADSGTASWAATIAIFLIMGRSISATSLHTNFVPIRACRFDMNPNLSNYARLLTGIQ